MSYNMGFLNKLKNLDAYPKINEDFYKRTLSGGIITAISGLVIFLLFISETRLYLKAATETNLVVDTSRGERLQVYFDITFPEVPCTLLSIDTQDISGEQHYDIRHDITKKRLHVHGHVIESTRDGIGAPKIDRPLQKHGGRLEHDEKYCGTCYGAEATEDQCCNTCEEVQEAYRKKGWALPNLDFIDQCARESFVERVKAQQGEGCNVDGFLDVSKVAGNVHFTPGKGYHHSNVQLQELADLKLDNFNITHKINRLSFGTKIPGVVNPLDGSTWTQTGPSGTYQYFIKVVPTIYTDVAGHEIKSNQFSVTEHYKDGNVRQKSQPNVVVYYDFSPIKVIVKEEKRSFLHYLTNLCAIVGGVFTVSGIIDSFIYHGQKAMKKKKIDLGKFT